MENETKKKKKSFGLVKMFFGIAIAIAITMLCSMKKNQKTNNVWPSQH